MATIVFLEVQIFKMWPKMTYCLSKTDFQVKGKLLQISNRDL